MGFDVFGNSPPKDTNIVPEWTSGAGAYFKASWEGANELTRAMGRQIFEPVSLPYVNRTDKEIQRKYLQEKYGDEIGWKVPYNWTEDAVAQDFSRRKRMIAADELATQAGVSNIQKFGLGFGASFGTPENILFQFTPIPWLERAKALEAGMNAFAKVGYRAGIGAFEGAAGAALYEPLNYVLNRDEGNDYTFKNSLENVFFAAGTGTVLRPLFLGAVDHLQGIKPAHADIDTQVNAGVHDANLIDLETVNHDNFPNDYAARVPKIKETPDFDPLPQIAKEASFETRVNAMAMAVEQVSNGEMVNVIPVFEAAKAHEIDVLAQSAQRKINFLPIKNDIVETPNNKTLPVQYAIVELQDMVASHTQDGQLNPDYPQAMQPRDRSQSTSDLQIMDIANNLNPRRLGETFDAQTGAPIIGTDGVVESGNGRTLALERIYGENGDKAIAYKDYLREKNYDISGFNEPVLVRIADANRPVQDRISFAKEANSKQTGAYNAAELASMDAQKITLDDLYLHQGGDITKASNAEFTKRILSKIANSNEMGELIDAKSRRLSQMGEDRIRAALVKYAFGDNSIVRDLFTRTENELKGIGVAMADIAPQWAKMREAARTGQIAIEGDMTDHFVGAVNIVRIARQQGKSIGEYISNLDMFNELRPATQDLLHLMFGEKLDRQINAQKIKQGLEFIIEQAMLSDPSPNLLGEPNVVSVEQLARQARKSNNKADQLPDAKLPESTKIDNGGGNGENGANGKSGERKNLPEQAGQGIAPDIKAGEKFIASINDPELLKLRNQDAEISNLFDAIKSQGLFDKEQLAAVENIQNEYDQKIKEANAINAAAYCLATTIGGDF